MLKELIEAFEEIKKYYVIIDRGTLNNIIIKFKDENFFHLVGLHKTKLGMFIPIQFKSKSKQYKYVKSHIDKYEAIFQNQLKEYSSIKLRASTLKDIKNIFDNDSSLLYNLKIKTKGSQYNGDYGILKIQNKMYYLLGLKENDIQNNIIYCAPQSWMVSRSINKIVYGRNPIYKKDILLLSKEELNNYLQ